MAQKTQHERREEQRKVKLEAVAEQIESGNLTVRKMTDAERERHAPRTPGKPRTTTTGRGRKPLT